jgi:hypothetical protein
MLHYEAIDSKTLELLKLLQKVPDFKNLRLVGGTSLSLQIGHRKSIDIDLFGTINSDELEISKKLDQIGMVTKQKYHDGSTFLVLKSLAYFNDADSEEDPFMLKSLRWESVKEFIIKKLEQFSKKSE